MGDHGWASLRKRQQEQNEKEYRMSTEADFITGRILAMNPSAKWETVHAEIMRLLKPNN